MLRPGIVKLILNGQNNLDRIIEKMESKGKRVAVAIPILKLIKKNLVHINTGILWWVSKPQNVIKRKTILRPLLGKDIVLKISHTYKSY
jgi:hypothetical protein